MEGLTDGKASLNALQRMRMVEVIMSCTCRVHLWHVLLVKTQMIQRIQMYKSHRGRPHLPAKCDDEIIPSGIEYTPCVRMDHNTWIGDYCMPPYYDWVS